MAPDQRNVARRWLAKADDDVIVARLCSTADPPLLDMAAYHCQQAAEKLLKAALVAKGERPPRTHDLDVLADAVEAFFPGLQPTLAPLRALTPWAWQTRYPDAPGLNEPTPHDIAEALAAVGALSAALSGLI